MIVMKFGGTSVEDAGAIERAAAIVKSRLPQKPVVVVSAMASPIWGGHLRAVFIRA